MGSVLETLLETRTNAAQELETRRSGLMGELEKLVQDADGNPRPLTEAEEQRSTAILAEVDQIDAEIKQATETVEKRLKEERKRAKREARLAEARQGLASAIDVKVESEPLVYGCTEDGVESPNSYYADLCRRSLSGYTGNDGGASQRLAEWAHQMERELALGGPKGREIEKQVRELNREFGAIEGPKRMAELRDRGRVALDAKMAELEQRSVVSGGGATASAVSSTAAAFVTPIFYVSKYAPYRELGRPFADACAKQPLPEYGMTVYVPAVQSAIEVAIQQKGNTFEGNAVNETGSLNFGYISGSLNTVAGEQFITQQLLDRAGPNFQFDVMIFDQLNRNYANKFDLYTLEAALTSAEEVSWEGSGPGFKLYAKGVAGGFVGQVAKAKAKMRTTAGTVLNPSHLFLTQNRWEHISATTDENGRPLVNPDYAAPWAAISAGNATGDEGIEGDTGYKIAGLPVYTDGVIPKHGTFTGTTEQEYAILGALQEVWVYEGPAVTRALPQTKGTELLVLLQRYSYYTVIKRYAKAVSVITGTGMQVPVYTN